MHVKAHPNPARLRRRQAFAHREKFLPLEPEQLSKHWRCRWRANHLFLPPRSRQKPSAKQSRPGRQASRLSRLSFLKRQVKCLPSHFLDRLQTDHRPHLPPLPAAPARPLITPPAAAVSPAPATQPARPSAALRIFQTACLSPDPSPKPPTRFPHHPASNSQPPNLAAQWQPRRLALRSHCSCFAASCRTSAARRDESSRTFADLAVAQSPPGSCHSSPPKKSP